MIERIVNRCAVMAAVASFALANSIPSVSAQTIQEFFKKVLPPVSQSAGSHHALAGKQKVQPAEALSPSGIAAVQELLGRLGYDAGTADGVFGRRTRNAMNRFQREHGLQETHAPDQATLDVLRAAGSTAGQQPSAPLAQEQVAKAGATAIQPGFDCGQAATPTEHAICASADLSRMDRDVATIYGAILGKAITAVVNAERGAQRAFLVERNACGAEIYCLFPAYLTRLEAIRETARQVDLAVVTGPDGLMVTPQAAPQSSTPLLQRDTEQKVVTYGSNPVVQQGGSKSSPDADLAENQVESAAVPSHSPAEGQQKLSKIVIPPAGTDLSSLLHLPEALTSWSFDTFDGVPLFDEWAVGSVIMLARMQANPGYLEDDQCDIARRFLRREVLDQVLTREHDKCRGGKIIWPGANEFEKQDNEQAFLKNYAPQLAAQAIKLPVTFAVSDLIGLAAFDAASSSFPLADSAGHLINAVLGTFPNQRFFLGPEGSTSRRNIVGLAPLPEQKLLVSGPEEARRLIADVTGWERRDAKGKVVSLPQDSRQRRTVRRVAVIELTSIDPQSGLINARLKSLGLYNLDLSRQLHAFPVSRSAGSIVAEGLPSAFSVPQFTTFDAFYAALRQAADDNGSISETGWRRIDRIVSSRDDIFYKEQMAGNPELQDLQLDDARRPFLIHGEYQIGTQRLPLLRQWAKLLSETMPAEIEQRRPFTYRDTKSSFTFTAPGWDSRPERSAAAESLGFQANQLVAIKDMPGVLVVLPNEASLFTLELPASALTAHLGKEITARTVMQANGPVRFVADGEDVIALLPMSPRSISVMANGVDIASRSFADVPHLDGRFMADITDEDGTAFAQPQPLSNAAVNLLAAAHADNLGDDLVQLVVQRAHLELAGDAAGGRFFIAGKRAPTIEEAEALAADFQSWARRRIGAAPDIIDLDARILKQTQLGPASASWSDLQCLGSTRDEARISSNQRVLGARLAVAEMNGGTLSTEQELHKLAIEREPMLADMVVRIGCDREAERRSLLPIYVAFSSALPAGPQGATTARLKVRVEEAEARRTMPSYLELLPDDMRERMIDRWSPKPEKSVSLGLDLLEVVYFDDGGLELARISPPAGQTRAGIVDDYVSARDRPSLSESGQPYGPDILGIKVGMNFDEAEVLIRQHMQVGRILKGVRAFDGSLQSGRTHPATSGKLFISEDGKEFIALIDEAPLREGRVLVAWRRLYLEPNTLRFEDAAVALVEKYGNAGADVIHEGWRNTWLTPDGQSNCRSSFTYGGERPGLSSFWKDEGGSDQVLMLPDGLPVPDAMIPADIRHAATNLDDEIPHCGPAFTAELMFDASRYANAGHVTRGLDWIETIISDVGPYIEAFRANRESLAETGGGQTSRSKPAIRF